MLVTVTANLLAAQTTDKTALLQGVGKLLLPVEPDALGTTVTINEQPEIILTAEVAPDDPDQSFQLITLASSHLGKSKLVVFGSASAPSMTPKKYWLFGMPCWRPMPS